MTLLFSDGFDSYGVTADFPDKGWVNADPTDATFEASSGRDGGGCANIRDDDASRGALGHALTLTTEVVRCAFWCKPDAGITIDTLRPLIIFNDVANTARFNISVVAVGPNAGAPGVTEFDDTAVGIIANATTNIIDGNWHHIELHFILGTLSTADGTIELWVDGAKEISRVGDIINHFASGKTLAGTVERFGLGPPANSPANVAEYLVDDVVIWDDVGADFTGRLEPHRIETLRPTAEGNNIDFTPSTGVDNSALIDEVAADDSDHVESAVSTNKDTYAYGNLAFAPASIPAVVTNTRAENTDVGAISFKAVARSNVTETDGGSVALDGTPTLYQEAYELDPNGDIAWAAAAVDAAEFGFKVV